MNNKVDYKKKYLDLRSKFVSSLDVAYRLGYEQATKDATVQQAQMQMQQAQMQMQQAAQQQGMIGQQMGGSPEEMAAAQDQELQEGQDQQPSEDGNEVDQYIAQIEDLVNKTENVPEDLKKALQGIKAVKTKPNFSFSYKHNLPEQQKKVLTKQEEIVENLMKKWDEEAKNVTNDIIKTIKTI